jgi:hypothetical protein
MGWATSWAILEAIGLFKNNTTGLPDPEYVGSSDVYVSIYNFSSNRANATPPDVR